jgi:hypothetical protein
LPELVLLEGIYHPRAPQRALPETAITPTLKLKFGQPQYNETKPIIGEKARCGKKDLAVYLCKLCDDTKLLRGFESIDHLNYILVFEFPQNLHTKNG